MDGATFAYADDVQAYAPRVSVGCGDQVPVAVSAPVGRYVLRAWRVGDYHGAGARVLWTSTPFTARPQRSNGRDLVTAGPAWSTSVSVTVTAAWPPGLYLLQVVDPQDAARQGGWTPLIVHSQVGSGATRTRAAAVYVGASMTWAAYNPYGGASLYRSFSGPAATAEKRRARVVALARPSVLNGQRQIAEYTAPLVAAIESAGVDVDYVTDTDVDATPSLLADRAEVIVGSHAEYVTTRIYDTLEAARNAGTNLAFLGGNQLYWHVQLSRLPDGTPATVLLHRALAEDPNRVRAPQDVTVRWRDTPLNRPEATLIGAQYSGLGVVAPWLTLNPPRWTGWADGDVFPSAAAGEVDAATAASPPRTQILAQGTTRTGHRWLDNTVTYYVAPSGAAVLDTGSMDTGCLVRATCAGLPTPAHTREGLTHLVTTTVRGFATARFGVTHPIGASAGTWTTGQTFAARHGTRAIGKSLRDNDD
jgi:hypothetical protein